MPRSIAMPIGGGDEEGERQGDGERVVEHAGEAAPDDLLHGEGGVGASITISPCAMLMTPITPKVMARPMAASSSTEPSEMPYQTFCAMPQARWVWFSESMAAWMVGLQLGRRGRRGCRVSSVIGVPARRGPSRLRRRRFSSLERGIGLEDDGGAGGFHHGLDLRIGLGSDGGGQEFEIVRVGVAQHRLRRAEAGWRGRRSSGSTGRWRCGGHGGGR